MSYLWDEQLHIYRRAEDAGFDASPRTEQEERLLEIVAAVSDKSLFSQDLVPFITDWNAEYHLGRSRHCLVRPLNITAGDKVLELGCECGAITRFLGEIGASVVAVEHHPVQARIAADRCRDLGNVRIVADAPVDFQTDERFDYVLMVGVLEKAALFSVADQPFQHCLRSASRFLSPTGRILIAIENKLGLKYFNGCEDDQTGIPYFGIQDLYPAKGPRTFGKTELIAELSAAGLPHLHFYYPFPDYKVPQVILSDEAMADASFDPIDLLARSHARCYSGSPYRNFDDALALSTLKDSGLLADLSNSFLVVASPEPQLKNETTELAFAYSVNRIPDFTAQTRFVRQRQQIRVMKERLVPHAVERQILVGKMTITNRLAEADYRPGRQILWKLLAARASANNLASVVQALSPWMEFLYQRARICAAIAADIVKEASRLSSYLVPSDLMDCTPFNLIDTGEGLVNIDIEWHSSQDVSLGWVVTRGLLWALGSGVPAGEHLESITEVIQALCGRFALTTSESEVQAWIEQEVEFQRAATGISFGGLSVRTTSNGKRLFTDQIQNLNRQIAELSDVRQVQDNRIGALDQALHERDQQIAAIEQTVAERDGQIDAIRQAVGEQQDQISRLSNQLSESEQQAKASRVQFESERAQLESERAQLESKLSESTSRAEHLQEQLGEVRGQLAMLQSSFSWRATAVLRAASARFPRIKKLSKSALRLVWWTITLQLLPRLRARRRLMKERDTIASSPLFDAAWYVKTYPDVAAAGWDPALHYALFGTSERRNPSPRFDAAWYLDQHRDVAEFGVNPLLHYFQIGKAEGRKTREVIETGLAESSPPTKKDYQEWVESYDTISSGDADAIRDHISALAYKPLISIIMPVYNTNPVFLRQALDSVLAQLYPHWELCVADDASTDPDIRTILERYARQDPRIKVVYRSANGHISAASNSALEIVSGEFVALMDHDDELPPHALYMIVIELTEHPDTDILYSDEDKIDSNGKRHGPYFKTDWNQELFYSQNMINHLGVYRTSLVRQAEGFRIGLEGSQDYDLVLRLLPHTDKTRIRHIPHILYHWRRGEGVPTFSTHSLDKAVRSAHLALADYFRQRGDKVQVEASNVPYWNRIARPLPSPAPRVSLIIPTRDQPELLKGCIEGLLHNTSYPDLELIIVDNESSERATLDYLYKLQEEAGVRILKIDGPFNFSAFNNCAAAVATGDILGFINNDIKVIDPGWLTEMVSQVVQPGVGAVGAKLYYADNTVQHAGVILGMQGVAGHGLRCSPRSAEGYYGRLQLVQNVGCVTAACMLVPKRVFLEIGGFDEVNLKVSYNDVDLCLEIRDAGYDIVWTPYAELYHFEAVSRGSDLDLPNVERARREYMYMRQRWGTALDCDPFYNPNLSLNDTEFSIAFPPRVSKPWRAARALERSNFRQQSSILEAQQRLDHEGKSRFEEFLMAGSRLSFPCPASPTLSVLMVFCNKAHLSFLALEALRTEADVSYELIIVDNNSQDRTTDLLDRIDGARILRNMSNTGFGPACMQAAEEAKGDFLCFLNNDALLQAAAFSAALRSLTESAIVGAVGGKILLANGDLQEAGDIVWSDGRALGYGRGDNANRPQYNFRRPVDFCSGAFLLTPRALFSELGGFSLKYLPAYYEDTDYCMKVWAHGLRVIYEPRAVIRHYESASSGNNKNAHFLMENSRSKFVSAWTAELREHHLPMSPANIHRARFAAASSQLSLLYIDDAIPHRYLGAGYPRSNAILHEIVRLGYRVACLATSSALNGNEYTDIPRDVELLDFFADAERLDGFLATCDRVWISRPNNMKRFARQIITKRPFRKYKVIYDAEAIFAERDYLQCIVEGQRLSSDTLERWIAREVAPARAVDKVVCVSQHDAKHIAAAGVPTPVVVGHYVEPRPTPARFSERQDFLFVGRIHGGKDPNTDSMDYFCTTIWPALRDATGATLMIAGQGSDNFKQAGNLRGVRILGPVEDLARVYNAARVFVVPTRYAAGIPLKVYEAAGYGLPAVISTLVGIQTGWQHNQECLIGNTPAEFIECCSRLYRDESLWNRLRANSLRKVETELNWGTFASALRNVLEVPDGAPKS